jgi:hypothetical protein
MDFRGEVSRRTLDIGAWRLLRRHAPAESFDLPEDGTLATTAQKSEDWKPSGVVEKGVMVSAL